VFLDTVISDNMMTLLQKEMIYVCVHVHRCTMPIIAWPLLQVIPINECIFWHMHMTLNTWQTAYVVHQMCLLHAWLPSENIIASSEEDVSLVIVF